MAMDYRQAIINEANRQGVPVEIALAVAQQESGTRHYGSDGSVIRGAAGEYGIFQLMPGTAQEVGVDPADPIQNIRGGITYLRKMYGVAGSWPGALIAYNGGPGTYASGGAGGYANAYAQASSYSQQVMARAGLVSVPGGGGAPAVSTSPVVAGDGGWDFGDWLASWGGGGGGGPEPVYGSDVVFTSDVVGDPGPNVALLLVLGLAAAVVVSQA